MQSLIDKLQADYPDLKFKAGSQFYWSPETDEIIYSASASPARKRDAWSLLHETGHALLEHKTYRADFELLKLEIAAWARAKQLAEQLKMTIDNEHIEDCLDTYRDWLYKRSICPTCTSKCLQQGDFLHYRCFNCHTTWQVSSSHFCRAYRRTKDVQPTASQISI